MSENKTAVVLPGSAWQVPLVKRLKKCGHAVFVVDPHDDPPARAFADGQLQSDIFDIKAVESYCKQVGADALMSDECDIAMPLVARLCARLSLGGIDEQSAHLFTNKHAMREFCKRNGIAHPEYELCRTASDARAFFQETEGPVVLKPLDSNSSRGVHIVKDACDIPEAFEDALSFSKAEDAVLIERFIAGREFTVDGVKTPNTHYSLAISIKKHFRHNASIASELYFTNYSNEFDYQELKTVNDRLMNCSPLFFGLTHAEYKFQDGTFYLIEAAARGGGNLISSHIVPFISGFDNYGYLIDCCLGGAHPVSYELTESLVDRCAVLKFLDCPTGGGIVKEVRNADIFDTIPEIVAHGFNFKPGDIVDDAVNDATRLGFYIALCQSQDRLGSIMQAISQEVTIELR